MIKLIIFDFDGTIGDTQGLIVCTMQETLRVVGLPVFSAEECASTIGLPLKECFTHLMEMGDETASLCEKTYREIFTEKNKQVKIAPFPNVVETLKNLHEKGYTLTIASSRGHESLDDFVRDMKLESYIRLVLGAEDVTNAKPDAEPVLKTLNILYFTPEETLVVGDMAFDILMGRNAGTKTCGVTYGNGKVNELLDAGADYIINNFAKLPHLLKTIR